MNQIYNANFTPQTQQEVEQATALHCREIESDKERSFLHCQLGLLKPVRGQNPIFILRAHGSSWPEAYKMWRKGKLDELSRSN